MASPGRLSDEQFYQALHYSEKCDKNKEGVMSRSELAVALRAAFPTSTEEEIQLLLTHADLNGDGIIQYQEFWDWVRLEPRERFSFEERVRLLQRVGRHDLLEPPHALDPAGLSRSATSEDASFEEIVERFTHPLLSRFTVCEGTFSKAGKVVVKQEVARFQEGSAELVPSASTGEPRLKVGIPRLPVDTGAARFLDKLEAVAAAFTRIFEVYCNLEEHTGLVEVPEGAALLMDPFQLQDDYRSEVPLSPEVFWSGAAVALIRLRPSFRERLQSSSIEVVARSSSHKQALEDKVRKVSEVLRIDAADNGRMRNNLGYDWVMKKNDPEARLLRMQAFFDTLHAGSDAGVLLPPAGPGLQTKKLLLHTEPMVRGVSVWEEPQLSAEPGSVSDTLRIMLPEDIPGYSGRNTTMEVAGFLAKQGKNVVAVNAASAYHVGGGVTTGGRHALEEAWCMTSTLFKALESVSCKSKGSVLQHVPTRGCIVAPGVEIFRDSTAAGYGFLPEAVLLTGVISVAMFNRNPAMSDCPVDCPSDPKLYIQHTKAKLQSVVGAAMQLEAEVLVVPDVGCGVFQNDPALVGGCLGAALRECGAAFKEVVITTHNADFNGACHRALHGEDPRPTCTAGTTCDEMMDKRHAASFAHEGVPVEMPEDEDTVTAALILLAEYPKEIRKPMCRYGVACRIKKPEHLARYDHPAIEDPRDRKGAIGGGRLRASPGQPAHPIPPAAKRRGLGDPEPPWMPAVPSPLRRKEACRYGRRCYNRNPEHLERFSHPDDDDAAVAKAAAPAPAGAVGRGGGAGGLGATGPLGRRGVRAQASPPEGDRGGHDDEPPAPPPESPPPSPQRQPSSGGGEPQRLPSGEGGEPHVPQPSAPPLDSSGRFRAAASSPAPQHPSPQAGATGGLRAGASPEPSPTKEDQDLVHSFLSELKKSSAAWQTVIDALKVRPGLVNYRPANRNFGFIHFCAHHVRLDVAQVLVGTLGADVGLLTRDGQTALQVLQHAMTISPAVDFTQKQKDELLLRYFQDHMDGTAARAAPAAGGTRSRANPVGGILHRAFEGGTDASRPPVPQPGGTTVEVKDCTNTALNGPYIEITSKSFNGYPSYWKESTQHYLYHTRARGWCINDSLSLSDDRPLACLGRDSFCGDEVWSKSVAEDWSVRGPSVDSMYMVDKGLRVCRLRPVANRLGHPR